MFAWRWFFNHPTQVICDEDKAGNLCRRLEDASDTAEKLRQAFHTASISVAVLHHGQVEFAKGIGEADIETGRVPDLATVYSIGSCTKSFTATTAATLDTKKVLDLEKPISMYMAEFEDATDPQVAAHANTIDFLSHSSGISNLLFACVGKFMSVLPKQANLPWICSKLPQVAPLRSEWQYNNWPYGLMAPLIHKTSGRTWTDNVRDILRILGMERTYTDGPQDDNYARSYVALDSGKVVETPLTSLHGGDAFDSAIMKASKLEKKVDGQAADTPEQALLQSMSKITIPRFPLSPDSEQKYCMGLFSCNLPSSEFSNITNTQWTTTPYKIGAKSPPLHTLGHSGDLGNFTSAFWTFPETESAVVVLANSSSANGDITHLVAQVFIQALFDLGPKIDFLHVASEIVENARLQWKDTVEQWNSHRETDTAPKPLGAYTGIYANDLLCMKIEVSVCASQEAGEARRSEQLRMRINDLEDQVIEMSHYDNDRWTFLPATRDELLISTMHHYAFRWEGFVMSFMDFESGQMRMIKWVLGLDDRLGAQDFHRIA